MAICPIVAGGAPHEQPSSLKSNLYQSELGRDWSTPRATIESRVEFKPKRVGHRSTRSSLISQKQHILKGGEYDCFISEVLQLVYKIHPKKV